MRRCPSDVYEAKFDEDYDYDLRNGPRLSRFRMHASGNLQLDGGSTLNFVADSAPTRIPQYCTIPNLLGTVPRTRALQPAQPLQPRW